MKCPTQVVSSRETGSTGHAARSIPELMRTHVKRLRAEDLVTEREPILMEAADGTVVEVFEWISQAAIEVAHSNPIVQEMWAEYSAVCEYVPVSQLPESAELFSGFRPLDFDD